MDYNYYNLHANLLNPSHPSLEIKYGRLTIFKTKKFAIRNETIHLPINRFYG